MRRILTIVATLAIPVAVAFGLALGLAACGEGDEPTPVETVTVTATPSAQPTDEPGGDMTVSLYFLRGESLGVSHRVVPASRAVATAAMDALLAGPNARERDAGLGTAIVPGTKLRGIAIDDGVARVDLNGAFASDDGSLSIPARVSQVVYTMTQFDTVSAVEFLINGKVVHAIGGEGVVVDGPQSRTDWADFLPAIFVESPAVGDVVTASRITVRGNASVFEATFVVDVLDRTGAAVTTKTVTAGEGAPGRGAFTAKLKLPPLTGSGTLVAYEVSMEDGSRMNEVRIPLRFAVEN